MINIALVGYGKAGKTFHAPVIESVDGLKLHSIVSSRESEILKDYPNVKVTSSIDDVLTDEIDLVIVATPNEFHFEHCKKSLLAGKHVVVDKPFTANLEQARELVNLASQKNVKLSVFQNRRFDGDFLTVKNLIFSGELGQIKHFESNFNRFRPKVDLNKWKESTKTAGGIFYDLAPHLIDQAINLFGPPLKIFADIDKLRDNALNDDYFHIIFAYEKLRVHLNASVLTMNPGNRFSLHGDKGSFNKLGLDPQENQLQNGILPTDLSMGVDAHENYGELVKSDKSEIITTIKGNYSLFYENIRNSIKENSSLEVSAEEALFIMEILELCNKSALDGRWIEI